MFLRLLIESFLRQRRRKLLAALAILLGVTTVTAMLALATTIGDRIHAELAVYGANIVVRPKADTLDVSIAGQTIKPATGNAYLHESDLDKLHTIFWANNITAVSPELDAQESAFFDHFDGPSTLVPVHGLWFNHQFGSSITGAPQLHPWWKLQGAWPAPLTHHEDLFPVAVGAHFAQQHHLRLGSGFILRGPVQMATLGAAQAQVSGIVNAGDETDDVILAPISVIQAGLANGEDAVSRIDIAARTRPEDALARTDPATLSPTQHDLWYCRPYANSIAYQIMEAIPNSQAEQVRKVEQSEGNILARISGLMWLVSAAALVAAGFAVSAAMATAVLERRAEIGLMRSLGASRSSVAALFYAESSLLALAAGTLGYFAGSALAWGLGARIFTGTHPAALNWVLLPVVLTLALLVALAGSTPSIRAAIAAEPSAVLRASA